MVNIFLLFISLLPAAEISFNGELQLESQSYFDRLSEPTRRNDVILQARPELDIKFNQKSRMHFKPQIRANTSTTVAQEQLFVNVQEAYWDIKTPLLKIKLGMNTYNWGVLDGYSTMDLTNGRVLFNPLQSDKRGAPVLELNYEHEHFQIQTLYIPVQARTLFPSADSRWLPREVIVNTSSLQETILLPTSFKYFYPGYEEYENALKNNFGMRLTSRYENFDFSAIYFEGSSITPQTRIAAQFDTLSISPVILQARSDVSIIPVYFRQRSVALSTVWVPEDFVVKFETTYSKTINAPNNPLLTPWSWQSGLGIEIPFTISETSITLLLQTYYGENEDAIDNFLSSSSRLFDRTALIGTRVSFSTDTTLLVSWLYNYRDESSYAHLKASHKLTDHWKLEITGDLLSGDTETLLGTYNANDRVSVFLSYLF